MSERQSADTTRARKKEVDSAMGVNGFQVQHVKTCNNFTEISLVAATECRRLTLGILNPHGNRLPAHRVFLCDFTCKPGRRRQIVRRRNRMSTLLACDMRSCRAADIESFRYLPVFLPCIADKLCLRGNRPWTKATCATHVDSNFHNLE